MNKRAQRVVRNALPSSIPALRSQRGSLFRVGAYAQKALSLAAFDRSVFAMLDREPDFDFLARPTRSTRFRAFENDKQDRIRQAFEPGNYKSLNHFSERPQTSRPRTPRRLPKMQRPTSVITGLFRSFPYLQDRYDKPELRKAVRDRHHRFVNEIGKGNEFVCSTPRGQERPQWQADPGRTLTPIQHIERSGAYTARKADNRSPFRPSGSNENAQDSRWRKHAMLGDIMTQIHKAIKEDWSAVEVDVYGDAEDLVVVEFQKPSKEERVGLIAYMNLLAHGCDVIVENGLVKLVERWNFPSGEKVYFTFQPPWVNSKSGEAFFQLHPSYRSWKLMLARKERQSMALSRPRSGRV